MVLLPGIPNFMSSYLYDVESRLSAAFKRKLVSSMEFVVVVLSLALKGSESRNDFRMYKSIKWISCEVKWCLVLI